MAVHKVSDPRRAKSPWAVSFIGSDGKRKLLYRKTRKDADKLLALNTVQVEKGDYENPSESRAVSEMAEAFLAAKRAQFASGALRASTLQDYEALAAQYIVPVLGRIKLRDLSRSNVERLRSRLLDDPPEAVQLARAERMAKRGGKPEDWQKRLGGVGSRTVGKVLTLLTMMLDDATARGWAMRNAAKGIAHGAPILDAVDRSRVLTDSEVAKLLASTSGMFRVMLLVALRTGIRQGEQLALAWGDIDLKGRRLHIRRAVRGGVVGPPKTKHSKRVVLLDDALTLELKRWRLACPVSEGRLVFPSEQGGYIGASSLSKLLRRLIGQCGIERPEVAGLRWHDLRHCFASHALAAGIPLLDVSRYLGHSSPMVTATVYAHAIPDREEQRREQLGQLYAAEVKHK